MTAEKGKTFKILKEKQGVPQKNLDQLKVFRTIKKEVRRALREAEGGEMSVPDLAKVLDMPASDTLYHLMSLMKYGLIEVARLDDEDEYYLYKLK